MPSEHQTGSASESYSSTAEKYVKEKDAETLTALVRGMDDLDELRTYLGIANSIEDREKVEIIVNRIQEVSE